MKILLTGGGTGGHLFPLIAAVRQIRKSDISAEFLFIGPDSFGQNILQQEKIPYKIIFSGKLRRYPSLRIVLDAFGFILGFFQSLWHVLIFMPDVIFSKGGYGSLPVVLAGWLYKIPILIHESDSIPGLVNSICGRFAKRIGVSFAETINYFSAQKTALVGNPVREEILNGSKEKAKEIFNLVGGKSVLLIIGGSQGAQAINEIVINTLPRLLEKCEIIHQCGEKNYENIKKSVEEKQNYHLLPFLDEIQLKNAYAAADLVISRAGAGSIFEIAACAKPSILIPLPGSAAMHQKENAYNYAKTGATIVLEQANLTPNMFQGRISQLLENPSLLQQMSECAKKFYRPDAAEKIAEELLNLAKL